MFLCCECNATHGLVELENDSPPHHAYEENRWLLMLLLRIPRCFCQPSLDSQRTRERFFSPGPALIRALGHKYTLKTGN